MTNKELVTQKIRELCPELQKKNKCGVSGREWYAYSIHLEHVLRAIGETKNPEGYKEFVNHWIASGLYRLQDSFSEQSEDVYDFLAEILINN
jgi:hypothetical protein